MRRSADLVRLMPGPHLCPLENALEAFGGFRGLPGITERVPSDQPGAPDARRRVSVLGNRRSSLCEHTMEAFRIFEPPG